MWSSYNPCSLFPPINLQRPQYIFPAAQRVMTNSTVCFVSEEKQKKKKKKITVIKTTNNIEESSNELDKISTPCTEKRLERNGSEWNTYQIAAVMFSVGITSMVVAAGYYRFSWQMQDEEIPAWEMFGTFVVSVGAAVGMEYWAKWAHRRIWHSSLWQIHESHHLHREGLFELNDLLAIINAIPAISLLFYGFFNRGLLPGICFASGLEITMFGMVYMFIHDGLVHRRFPVGPIANIPYFRRIAAAHQIHHSDKFSGVPYGFFLGHKELEEVGGLEELEKEINRRIKLTGHHD